jgi:hypothetical protein
MAKPIFDAAIAREDERDAWKQRFFEAARQAGTLFQTSAGLVYIPGCADPTAILNNQAFHGCLHEAVEIRKTTQIEGGPPVQKPYILDFGECGLLFYSKYKGLLPEVDTILSRPVAKDGVILEEGYHPAVKTFIYRKPGRCAIRPTPGTTHLDRCFSSVAFADGPTGAFRNNLFAWMLGGALFPTFRSPLLVLEGNQRGIGKTSVARAVQIILRGEVPVQLTAHGGKEFAKEFGSQALSNDRILLLDNIVSQSSFSNNTLTQVITADKPGVRILGGNKIVSMSYPMVMATFNNGKLDADLSTRSLLVRLHAEARFTPEVNCEEYAKEHADAIYAELLHIALSPPTPKSIDIGVGFRFDAWVRETCGRFPATSYNLGAADTLEDQYQELFCYGRSHCDDPQPAYVIAQALSNFDFYKAWSTVLRTKKSDHAKSTMVGMYLNQRVGQIYEGVRLDRTDGRIPTYTFTLLT